MKEYKPLNMFTKQTEEIDNPFKELTDSIKNMLKAFEELANSMPKYMINEMLHPNKKPRGSIRRLRKEKKNES